MTAPTLSAETLRQLAVQPLNGNVRELENLLHRAVALSEGTSLQIDASLDQRDGSLQNEALTGSSSAGLAGNSPQSAAAERAGLPDDLQADTSYYRPTDRGFEQTLATRWALLRALIRGRGTS